MNLPKFHAKLTNLNCQPGQLSLAYRPAQLSNEFGLKRRRAQERQQIFELGLSSLKIRPLRQLKVHMSAPC